MQKLGIKNSVLLGLLWLIIAESTLAQALIDRIDESNVLAVMQ